MEFTFFWNGPFSQWDSSPFMALDGLMYSCAEQYMMAQKALLFQDKETFKKIMATTHPRDQKKLGRTVKNFNQVIWNTYSTTIVYDGNLLKFSQNPKHWDLLNATGDSILVEASPFDRIWGIGLPEGDRLANNISTWKGQNRLGFILTKVRETIRDENVHGDESK